jgi:hypothetical protein
MNAIDPHGFHFMLQFWAIDGPPSCYGTRRFPLTRPTRMLVVADAAARTELEWLFNGLGSAFAERGGSFGRCDGPADLACWATAEPHARNILVVVASDVPPSAELEQFASVWTNREGFEAIGIVRADANPDVVLPAALRLLNAAGWRADPREVVPELFEAVLLDAEDRRIFVSYARRDGTVLADRVFDLLARARFDVFLDRFRLPPGVDFLQRIQDEILDKAMVVVIETPAALASHWVREEVNFAIARGLGIVAVNTDGTRGFREISEELRTRSADPDPLRHFLIEQHRVQLTARREGLRESVWDALRHAGIPAADISESSEGFSVTRPAGTALVGTSVRPADLHRFRRLGETSGHARSYIVHPQPALHRRRQDLSWLSQVSSIVEVDAGRFVEAAEEIARW